MGNHTSRCSLLIYFDISDYYFDCAHLFSPGDKASQGAGRACQGEFLQGALGLSHGSPPAAGRRETWAEWGGGGCEQAWTVAEPEGLWGELQSLRIRKVRISEFRLHFCFQMCHFPSKPLMHMCFWLRTGDPGVAQELSCSFQCLSQRKGRILPLGGGGRRER